jgi:hypothetical protein
LREGVYDLYVSDLFMNDRNEGTKF